MLIAALVLFTSFGCYNPFMDQENQHPGGITDFNEERHYTFEPETILTSLAQNKGEIFQPVPGFAEENVFPPGSFAWSQQDYLKIASALNKNISSSGAVLEEWELYSMIFSRDCADNPIGFDDFRMTYFKTAEEQYTVREMKISPLSKSADWGGNTYFRRPFLFGWKGIDLKKLKVTADDALQIAEVNGGKAARLAVNNKCYILEALSFNLDKNGWNILYSDNNFNHLFQMSIDPYSDKYYELLTPSK